MSNAHIIAVVDFPLKRSIMITAIIVLASLLTLAIRKFSHK